MKTANSRLRGRVIALVETALLVAIAFGLSWIRFSFPFGGSITPMSMLPIIVIGHRRGLGWGLGGAFCYAMLQLTQFYPPPISAQDAIGAVVSFALVVLLDYLLAFTVLGMSGLFSRKKYGLLISIPVVCVLRWAFHVISGILIWWEYAGDLPVWLYSVTYNTGYIMPEMILCFAVTLVLMKTALKKYLVRQD